jgi:hypothetical protein
MTDDELKGHVCAGLNYPPSQYQLHVQFILPPLLPFHYHLYQRGTHFTHKRFFPVEYVTRNAARYTDISVTHDAPSSHGHIQPLHTETPSNTFFTPNTPDT